MWVDGLTARIVAWAWPIGVFGRWRVGILNGDMCCVFVVKLLLIKWLCDLISKKTKNKQTVIVFIENKKP